MDECEDLDNYNGDVEHDMWVDFDRYENTGEPAYFEEVDLEVYIDGPDDLD